MSRFLTRAQRDLLRRATPNAATGHDWVKPEAANEIRTRDALVRRGLLERHPVYGGSVYRLTLAGREALDEEEPG